MCIAAHDTYVQIASVPYLTAVKGSGKLATLLRVGANAIGDCVVIDR